MAEFGECWRILANTGEYWRMRECLFYDFGFCIPFQHRFSLWQLYEAWSAEGKALHYGMALSPVSGDLTFLKTPSAQSSASAMRCEVPASPMGGGVVEI